MLFITGLLNKSLWFNNIWESHVRYRQVGAVRFLISYIIIISLYFRIPVDLPSILICQHFQLIEFQSFPPLSKLLLLLYSQSQWSSCYLGTQLNPLAYTEFNWFISNMLYDIYNMFAQYREFKSIWELYMRIRLVETDRSIISKWLYILLYFQVQFDLPIILRHCVMNSYQSCKRGHWNTFLHNIDMGQCI